MTLDTVISGCAVFEERSLDAPCLARLEHCLSDLDALLPSVPEETGEYFTRLRTLAGLLLATGR